MSGMDVLDERQWAFLYDVAADIVPAMASLDAAGRERFRVIVAHALAMRRPTVRRQFGVFLRVVRLAPVARFGKPFDRLAHERRGRTLRWLQDCPLPALRKGFWGLKTLVLMGYYGQEAVYETIHYTPSHDGNPHLDA